MFKSLIKSGDVTILSEKDQDPEGCVKNYVNEQVSIYVKVVGIIDIKLEVERVAKRNEKLDTDIAAVKKKMTGKVYDKVPEKVKATNNANLLKFETEKAENLKSIEALKKFM